MSKDKIEMGDDATVKDDIRVDPPREWKIIFHNDDYTTVEFVVDILTQVYYKIKPDAELIAAKIHRSGKAIIGTYSKDIAETKLYHTHKYAEENDYPLQATMEQE